MSLVTSKFAQKCRITATTGSPTNYDFEIDNLQFGFLERFENFTLWNRKVEKVVIDYRFTARFSSRFLRAGATGSEMVDVINETRPLTFLILDIGMTAVPVNFYPNNIISITNQRIIPDFDFQVEGIDPVSTVPAWFKFTRAKPGYL